MKSPSHNQAWSFVLCIALLATPGLAQQATPAPVPDQPLLPTPAPATVAQPATEQRSAPDQPLVPTPAPATVAQPTTKQRPVPARRPPEPSMAQPASTLNPVPGPVTTVEDSQPREFRIFALKYAKADDILETLGNILGGDYPPRVVADPRANRLIVSATADQFRTLADLVAELDVPATQKSSAREIRVYPLKYARSEILVKTLQQLSPDSMTAADPLTNSILVSANAAELSPTERLIGELDRARASTPQQSRKVRVVWLVSDMDLPDPPPDMKDVTDELESLGITNLRLVTQNMIQSTAGEEFAIQSTPPGFLNCRVKIQGQFEESDTGSPRLKLSLNAVGKLPSRELPTQSDPSNAPPAPHPSGSNELASLVTTVIAPPGHKVVLGVTPIDKYTSVFVIQILASEAGK